MATDYKNSLNLPKTHFPMKANLPQTEPLRLAHWESLRIYQVLRADRKNRPKFVLHDGPPYANGDIHVGHAINKILKDMVVKSKTLGGYDAPYVPGWDCHGLPIEHQLEKKLGRVNDKVDANTFRRECRSYAALQVERQKKDFIRLGVLGDWGHAYHTMDYAYEATVVRSLKKIIENQHLEPGFKPVHWCTACGSSLAEAELEYQEKISPSVDVRFSIESASAWASVLGEKTRGLPVFILIWTTTPWTLPANQAVAVGKEIVYDLIRAGDECVVVARDLAAQVMARAGVVSHEVLHTFLGETLLGLKLQHPFEPRVVPIIWGDHVTTEAGTGLVHTAPAHGVEDFQACEREGISLLQVVNEAGILTSSQSTLEGQFVFKANPRVIDLLRDKGLLWHTQDYTHSYPHCWRHKTPVIFRATPQWFVSMHRNHLRAQALTALSGVEFFPKRGKAQLEKMIEVRPDWCISRQRTWGVPLPFFIHRHTKALHPKTLEILEQVAKRIEQGGIEAWFDADADEFLAPFGTSSTDYKKSPDTTDVWLDSGVSFAAVLQARGDLAYPADLYLEGSDQHRAWFNTSLLASVAQEGKAPYRQVLTHGYAVDDQGRKMSKSLGNVISPQSIIEEFGADVLRLWVASCDYRSELSVSRAAIQNSVDIYRRIRNTARFLLGNLEGFDPAIHQVALESRLSIDRWVIAHAREVQAIILEAYDQYEFHTVVQQVYQFCAMALGGFYLDVIKDRQYTCQTNSLARRSAQCALYEVLQALVRWITPILSFTAEEIWQAMPVQKEASVLLSSWHTLPQDLGGLFTPEEWREVILIREQVNKAVEHLRQAGQVGSSLGAEVSLAVDAKRHVLLAKLGEELRFVLISAKVTLQVEAGVGFQETELPGVSLKVEPSLAPKCVRCWHHCEEVGSDEHHPELCARCLCNVSGAGELRQHA